MAKDASTTVSTESNTAMRPRVSPAAQYKFHPTKATKPLIHAVAGLCSFFKALAKSKCSRPRHGEAGVSRGIQRGTGSVYRWKRSPDCSWRKLASPRLMKKYCRKKNE